MTEQNLSKGKFSVTIIYGYTNNSKWVTLETNDINNFEVIKQDIKNHIAKEDKISPDLIKVVKFEEKRKDSRNFIFMYYYYLR